MLFVSEDGTQRKTIDLSDLPVSDPVRLEIAQAVVEATGPLGVWKREGSAANIKQVCMTFARWVAVTRPTLKSMADLTSADARMLGLSYTDGRRFGVARSLLRHCEQLTPEFRYEIERHHIANHDYDALQPYTEAELRRICVAARGIARQARQRIQTHRKMINDYRNGGFDRLDECDPRRELAAVLDFCDRMGDVPRSPVTGQAAAAAIRTVQAAGGASLMPLIHLTRKEVWAFTVLLAALTGLNSSVLHTLPASYLRGSGPKQAGVAIVRTSKPRRGARSEGNQPLTTFADTTHVKNLLADASGRRETSLSTAFGVFATLIELTDGARRQLGVDRAFVYYTRIPNRSTGSVFKVGAITRGYSGHVRTWVIPWLNGDAHFDEMLRNITLVRLRKTRIELARKPIGHTRHTHHQYLRKMRTVVEDGFGIVREALDEQVARAVARRRIAVDTTDEAAGQPDTAQDTVLGCCDDIDHSPLDAGRRCQQNFLTCLECANARAFPRHLPVQLLVADALRALRTDMPIGQWVDQYSGYVSQLDDIFTHYSTAQIRSARVDTTDAHRDLAQHLLTATLDVP